MNYQLSIGNIGTLYFTSKKEALKNFTAYRKLSQKKFGRAAGEDVILLHKDEIIKEHVGTLHKETE